MKRILPMAVLAVWALSGCATLNVDVDVSTESGVAVPHNSEDKLRAILRQSIVDGNERNQIFERYVVQLGSWIEEEYTRTLVRAGAEQPAAQVTAERIRMQTIGLVRREWEDVVRSADALETAAEKVLVDVAVKGDLSGYPEILGQAFTFEGRVDGFRNKLEEIFEDLEIHSAFRARITLLTEQFTRVDFAIAASEKTAGRIVGYPIFDPRISRLKRDNEVWVDFVDARFRTFGGSAQFVAVREGLVVYRQKSLDFDPTPVVGAGAALAKLGLRVAAAQVTGTALFDAEGEAGKPGTAGVTIVDKGGMRVSEDALRVRRDARLQALNALAALLKSLEGNADATALVSAKAEYTSIVKFYQGQVAAAETSGSGGG